MCTVKHYIVLSPTTILFWVAIRFILQYTSICCWPEQPLHGGDLAVFSMRWLLPWSCTLMTPGSGSSPKHSSTEWAPYAMRNKRTYTASYNLYRPRSSQGAVCASQMSDTYDSLDRYVIGKAMAWARRLYNLLSLSYCVENQNWKYRILQIE